MQSAKTTRYVSRLTRDTLALVLAGGRGSRLKHLTLWRAKPAVPFGGKFRIIDFPLSNCINSGIRRVGVLTQYKAHSLIQHIQKGWGFLRGEFGEFVELLPAQQRIETSWYAGTADAVFQNLDIIRNHDPAYVLILAGDHIYKMDYGPMIARHVESGADVTVGAIEVPVARAGAFGIMALNQDGRVARFHEKPAQPETLPGRPDTALASMGIYLFNTAFLYEQLIKDADLKSSTHDFGRDILPLLIKSYRVQAYPYHDPQTGGQGYWRDVGTVDAYWEANMELIGVTPGSTCTMRVGRSGPIRSRCRRPSLYSTTTTAGAAWRWTRWSRAATSFPARWCAGRCCFPTCASRPTARSSTRWCCRTSPSAAVAACARW